MSKATASNFVKINFSFVAFSYFRELGGKKLREIVFIQKFTNQVSMKHSKIPSAATISVVKDLMMHR
jgi:hypothetical protein